MKRTTLSVFGISSSGVVTVVNSCWKQEHTVWKWDALLKLSNQQHKPDRKRAEHEESIQGSCCALYCPALKVFGPPLTSHNPPGSSITQRSDWCCKSRADPGSVSGGDCVRSPQALTEISWNWDPPVFSSLYQKGVEWRSGLLIKQAHTYDEWNHLKVIFWWECQREYKSNRKL